MSKHNKYTDEELLEWADSYKFLSDDKAWCIGYLADRLRSLLATSNNHEIDT